MKLPFPVPRNEPLTVEQQRSGMRHAIASACWGSVSQVMVRDSSVVIIFAALLGAGEMISVLTTALMDSAVCLLIIPFAYLCARVGQQRQIVIATLIGMVALLIAGTAPWFATPGASRTVLVFGLGLYSVSYSAYLSGWLPLLDGVVPREERGLFFGRMRFFWQLASALFILVSGWFVGRYASVGRLQVIVMLAALALLGRAWHIMRVPEVAPPPLPGWRAVGRDILRNRPLLGFAVYLFFLYAAANAFIPVVFVFSRNALMLPDNLIVMLSVAAMAGLILGYLGGGKFVHRYGVKTVFLGTHAGFGLLNFTLLGIHGAGHLQIATIGFTVLLFGVLFACASIAVTSELLALAPPANKAVSIAFGFSLYSAGLGFSRLATSLLLGSGMLSETWTVAGIVFTRYHSLFLFFGCGVLAVSVLLVLVPALVRDVQRLPGI